MAFKSERHPLPLTYMISGGHLTPADFPENSESLLDLIREAVANGVDLVQIREKRLHARQVFELVKRALAVSSGSGTRVLVNERFDIALASGADGVHLRSTSVPVGLVRRHLPEGMILGVSTHSVEEVLAAREAGADFAAYGPVFETPSKARYGSPKGVAALREVCAVAGSFPVFGLGGISLENHGEVLEAGASGIAGISLFGDVEDAARLMREISGRKAGTGR